MRTSPLEQRFWPKVVILGGLGDCWYWIARKTDAGYGEFWLDGKSDLAHRVAWTLQNGPIPQGLCVLHTCDKPSCVNPAHLFLGTQADNMRDKAEKGRSRARFSGLTECPKGHAFDAANTYTTPSGGRQCRTCNRSRRRARADRAQPVAG